MGLPQVHGEILRCLERGGVRLTYSWRPASQPPARGTVLLLHGLASNRSRYAEFVATTRLAEHWNLVRVDLRGHGESDTRSRLSLEAWCADLLALLDAERVQQAILVGHSLGAQVALAFAAAHPDRVAGLALIDPLPRGALNPRARRWQHAVPALRAAAVMIRGLNALGLRRPRLPLRNLRDEDEAARALLAAGRPLDDFVRDYASTHADLRHFRCARYLEEMIELLRAPPPAGSIAAPVLVLLSAAGTFAEPAAVREWVRGFARGALVTIDCHHWPLTEKPLEVRSAIEAWVEGL